MDRTFVKLIADDDDTFGHLAAWLDRRFTAWLAQFNPGYVTIVSAQSSMAVDPDARCFTTLTVVLRVSDQGIEEYGEAAFTAPLTSEYLDQFDPTITKP